MDDTGSVYEALRSATDTFDDDEDAARAVLDSARTRKDVVALVWPLVVAEANHQRRHRGRAIERRATRLSGGDPINVAQDRAAWLSVRFAVGDGRMPTWGEATVEDHQARIAWLTKLRDGIDRTIQQHMTAVATITGAGATCLNDLGDDLLGEVAA